MASVTVNFCTARWLRAKPNDSRIDDPRTEKLLGPTLSEYGKSSSEYEVGAEGGRGGVEKVGVRVVGIRVDKFDKAIGLKCIVFWSGMTCGSFLPTELRVAWVVSDNCSSAEVAVSLRKGQFRRFAGRSRPFVEH